MLNSLKLLVLAGCLMILSSASAFAQGGTPWSRRGTSDPEPYIYREATRIDKMGNKLGRGVTNLLTFWIEIPHSMAIEWNRREAVSGVLVGGAKGLTWGTARLVTGAYEVLTFPFPTPNDYRPVMYPEYIVTDTWGNTMPEIMDMQANDPMYDRDRPTYPKQFRF